MQAQPPAVDLGTGGLPAGQGAPSPVQSEIPEHYIENDAGHNASEAAAGIVEGLNELTWEAGKAAALDALSLGAYSFFGTAREVGRAGWDAWISGRWAGFSENDLPPLSWTVFQRHQLFPVDFTQHAAHGLRGHVRLSDAQDLARAVSSFHGKGVHFCAAEASKAECTGRP